MTKVIGMLVALAMFAAMPAVAFAGSSDDDNVSSGNTQTGNIDQGAAGGDGGSGSDDSDGGSGGGDGGDAGNQAAICQQNAGGDANCEIDQSQSFGGGDDDSSDDDSSDDDSSDDDSSDDDSSDDDDVTSGGTGGGVDSVTLAQTGFDAWVLALIGGLSLAGGLSLLVAQRRGRLNA